ncbi:pyridoxine 5'-phosphate synthase [Salegentibacter chungangensis]|uniref:Pyridoxine 5'-phosphate synthase n=1 Tax=Salegentibacter chungangensis TaxID=1335724 RepID=A0ABW3NPC2_9FLAO
MTKLSVNINKVATLRNARGGNMPNVLQVAKDIESFGGQGITVHPRPDERHITYQDVRDLAPEVTTEFNIEGNPVAKFLGLVMEAKPAQVTLVPDAEDAITSNAGWDTIKYKDFLSQVIGEFKNKGIRTSIFVDPEPEMIKGAVDTGTDRIELYTESYAVNYEKNREEAIAPYAECAKLAHELGLGINAGHDLSLENIEFFKKNMPYLDEVSIGHALISEALYLGFEKTIQEYLKRLK